MDRTAIDAAIATIDDEMTLEIVRRLAMIPAPLGEEGPLAVAVAELLDGPGIDVHLQTVVPGRPNDREGLLIRSLSWAHELVRGAPPEFASGLEQHAFVTDAPDLARFGLPTVGYGPGPWRYQADEWIELDELLAAPRIYLATALGLGG